MSEGGHPEAEGAAGRDRLDPKAEAPELEIGPDQLARHYSRFRVRDRILLTGHSHQAWPDVAFEAQQRAWLDAAEYVDDKWPLAENEAQRVREGFATLLGDDPGRIALGQNTHELLTRWLSALPLRARPRIVTTDGEFHSARRQLDRLAEEGLSIIKVPARPAATAAERLADATDDRTAGVIVSSVLFDTAEIVPELHVVAAACGRRGAQLLVDAYHHINVVPFDVATMGLSGAFVTGGGYKYCQLGEGNGFLRVPPDCRMRPALTGWFAELAGLDRVPAGRVDADRVPYAPGAAAFAGATFDPVSHYRAAAVFAFHRAQRLTATRLRDISRRQVRTLRLALERADIDPRVAHVELVPDERRGGFLAIRSPHARELSQALKAHAIWTDARGDVLRLGPAPYVGDAQLVEAAATLRAEIARAQKNRPVSRD
jgi:kynureninase